MSPQYQEPPVHPCFDQFQILGPAEGTHSLQVATWLGEEASKGACPCPAGALSGQPVLAKLLLPHIPRSSLMGTTSTCGTGAWSSSP